jgi:transposase
MHSTRRPGKKSTPPRDPIDPPRRRATTRKGHGTYANDRPPIISLSSRDTGEQRWWVCDHADRPTGHNLIADHVPPDGTWLYTDAWQSSRGSHPCHAAVSPGVHEWAREDHGDSPREVQCHTCEGAGAALRTDWRPFRGVHKQYLHLYVATDEALVKANRVTPELIRRLCIVDLSMQTGYT